MSQQLIVLARPDGPYRTTIQESVQIANDLQTYFRFKLEDASWLPKENGRHAPLADKAFRGEIKDRDGRTPFIVVTSIPLYGGNFAFEYRDRSVISLHDWEDNFTPPPVKVYLVYQLAYIAAIVAADLTDPRIVKMQHPPKGCLFDETEGADEFRVSLVGAHLCAACEGKLAEMMIPAEALEAVNEILGYVVAGEFPYIGKEASTRWAGGPDPSMMADAGALDPADETCREYERMVDTIYLDQIRTQAKQFSTRSLSRKSRVAKCAIINFKKRKDTIKPRTLRKLTRAIHDLLNKSMKK